MATLLRQQPALGCRSAFTRPTLKAVPVLAARVQRPSSIAQQHDSQAKPQLGACSLASKPTGRTAKLLVKASASAAAPAPAKPFKWGADMKSLSICVGVAVALWLAPAPAGVSAQAWHLLAIFTGTIVGIITTPLPLGAVAVLGLGASMLTKTLTFAEAFSAFANEIP